MNSLGLKRDEGEAGGRLGLAGFGSCLRKTFSQENLEKRQQLKIHQPFSLGSTERSWNCPNLAQKKSRMKS